MLNSRWKGEPAQIIFKNYGYEYTVSGISNDVSANELKEIFSRILVQAGFSPEVIQCEDGASFKVEVIGAE